MLPSVEKKDNLNFSAKKIAERNLNCAARSCRWYVMFWSGWTIQHTHNTHTYNTHTYPHRKEEDYYESNFKKSRLLSVTEEEAEWISSAWSEMWCTFWVSSSSFGRCLHRDRVQVCAHASFVENFPYPPSLFTFYGYCTPSWTCRMWLRCQLLKCYCS